MSAMSVVGNTTVVGAASDLGSNDFDRFLGNSSKSPIVETTGISATGKRPHVTFAAQDSGDLDEDRPFFVKIEKDGVLSAIRKLNEELKAVRIFWAPASSQISIFNISH